MWNKGYATEGSRALISMGFTGLDVERAFADGTQEATARRRSSRHREKWGGLWSGGGGLVDADHVA